MCKNLSSDNDDRILSEKAIVWIALVAVPVAYALARCTPWPLVVSFILHWSLACSVLVWARPSRDGGRGIGLRACLKNLH